MLVSLVVPTFNRANFLPDLLQSVAVQSYRPIEFILVDDGSKDSTVGSFSEFVAQIQDSGITWRILQTQNQGAPGARNLGISSAQGDAIMFVDSDDVLTVQGIEALACALKQDPSRQYAYGLVQRTDEKLHPLPEKPIGACFHGAAAEFAGYHWHTMGALYRRSCLHAVGEWNVQLKGSQDWEYQARVKALGGQGVFIPTVVGLWRQHGLQRVGASGFRPDYTRSVLLACELIVEHARRSGKCDDVLLKLMARRVLVHGIECGAHGHVKERQRCSALARDLYKVDDWFGRGLDVLGVTPPLIDKALHAILRWRRS